MNCKNYENGRNLIRRVRSEISGAQLEDNLIFRYPIAMNVYYLQNHRCQIRIKMNYGDEINYGSDPNDRWSNKLITRLKILGIALLIIITLALAIFIYIKNYFRTARSNIR